MQRVTNDFTTSNEQRVSFNEKWATCEKLRLQNHLQQKILKIKIKSYGDEAKDFNDKAFPKVWSNYTCLAVILINFVFKKEENYYPQVFLKGCNILRVKRWLDLLLMT